MFVEGTLHPPSGILAKRPSRCDAIRIETFRDPSFYSSPSASVLHTLDLLMIMSLTRTMPESVEFFFQGASSGKDAVKKGRFASERKEQEQLASCRTTGSQALHLSEAIPTPTYALAECPDDAWLAILRWLDGRTLLQVTSPVCKKWLELSRSDLVWANKLPRGFPRQSPPPRRPQV